jgi:hypothetical protein
MAPEQVLHYNIEKKLGEGGMGAVSLATERAAATSLYDLVAFGQIRFGRIDGYKKPPSLLRELWTQAA